MPEIASPNSNTNRDSTPAAALESLAVDDEGSCGPLLCSFNPHENSLIALTF